MKYIPQERMESIRKRLVRLYGDRAPELLERLRRAIGRYGVGYDVVPKTDWWDEKDIVLITYADMVQHADERPLVTLRRFLEERLKGAFKTVHILPFTTWSSDDGFSVIDYREVAPEYGQWEDIEALGSGFKLMFDLVLNHCSAQSEWFRDFVSGVEPASRYFIEADPSADLSAVVRPRPWPLLTKVERLHGDTHVWTTFSEDQVDLNWENPDLLFEFIDILFLYLSKGMSTVRLDAVAFLWKEIGTSCIHLPETHEVVKLLRDIIGLVAPHAIILTETNVPHEENISYFGQGDEAHMVYQFSLPPLLLYSLLKGDCQHLRQWASDLPAPENQTSFFNFTASHDGIGVRPLQGLIPNEELDWLIQEVVRRQGFVSTRRLPDNTESPYELNITYSSALSCDDDESLGLRRFLCSQAVCVSMRGIPGIYFHSLTATPNDLHGVQVQGHHRAVNRKKWLETELAQLLDDPDTNNNHAFNAMTTLLRRRASHPAFHPDATQEVIDFGNELFAFVRESLDQSQRILCLFNMSNQVVAPNLPAIQGALNWDPNKHSQLRDLLAGLSFPPVPIQPTGDLQLAPYQSSWLVYDLQTVN
mgnify:CR=1 FL=1